MFEWLFSNVAVVIVIIVCVVVTHISDRSIRIIWLENWHMLKPRAFILYYITQKKAHSLRFRRRKNESKKKKEIPERGKKKSRMRTKKKMFRGRKVCCYCCEKMNKKGICNMLGKFIEFFYFSTYTSSFRLL